MRKLYFLMLLFTGIATAQIVDIPDANFKTKLISLGIDTNTDGEIQESEALIPTVLDVSGSEISDLTGIQSFTNLTHLDCSMNDLLAVNLSSLTNLLELDCSSNYLTTINVGSMVNLTSLKLVNNELTAIQNLNLLVNLKFLSFYQNKLTSIDVSPLVNLTDLNTGNNLITTLDVHNNTNLTYLFCSQNMLSAIDISALVDLKFFYCNSNQISSLNLSNNNALIYLYCNNNELTNLDVSNLHSLTNLDCSFNLLTSLNVAGTNMSMLRCSYNPLISLDVTGLNGINHLAELYCSGTNLISLNLDAGRNIDQNLILECSDNPQLVALYMKNGSVQQLVTFNGNPNLSFICVDDENEANLFQSYVTSYGYTNCVVNSYCTFTPGGDFNTISTNVTYDLNGNGCDSADADFPNIRLNINDGTNSGANFTNLNGIANFYTLAGNFTITPAVENPTWFNFSPSSAAIPFADNNNNVVTQNFCMAANGIHPDVEVVIAPLTTARPGFDAVYKLVYKNKGNQTLTGDITFTYNGALLDFVSSDIMPTAQLSGQLTYDYTNLLPFESRSFDIVLNVNAPTDTPAVNIDDQLTFSATVNPIAGDENTSDNTFNYSQTVVGSFDPNDIICIEGDVVSPIEIGNYLHYIINFENTGTADAENIVVRDVIDATQFDVSSLQLLNSSASVTTRLTGNVAEFILPGIHLHSGGHGNILIKIKSNSALISGDTVSKKANIYFDYNFPVETLPENTIFQALSNPDVEADASILVYPNPTKGNVNINCNNNIKSVQLYDVQGRILQTNLVNQTQTTIDISGQSKGVYFLKITSDKGIAVQKIIRE